MKPGTKKKRGAKKVQRDKQLLRRYIQLVGETGLLPPEHTGWHHLTIARLAVEFRMGRLHIKDCIRSAATRTSNDKMVEAIKGWIPGIEIAWGGEEAAVVLDLDRDDAVRALLEELAEKPRAVGDLLPTELILKIQDHLPEGGRITIPPRPRHTNDGPRIRRMIPTEEVIRQDVEMTIARVQNCSLRSVGDVYGISHARVDTISVQMLPQLINLAEKG